MTTKEKTRVGLTDEEILAIIKPAHFGGEYVEVAKAQLKKVLEWGTDICGDHPRRYTRPRFECSQCMQALLEEVKE